MLQYQAEFVGNPTRESQYRQSAYMEHAKHTRKESPYLISVPMQVRALMLRRVQILKGDKLTVGLNVGYAPLQVSSVILLMDRALASSSWKPSSSALSSIISQTRLLRFTRGVVFCFCKQGLRSFTALHLTLHSAILFSALTTMAEIPALFSQREIVLRHYKAAMYHPFVESMALTLVDVPITFVTLIFFCIILYFLAHLQRTAGQFL